MKDKKEDLEALRTELENGLRFLHTLGMQSKIDLIDLTTRVLAITEVLISSGHLDLRAYEQRRELIAKRETERMASANHVAVILQEAKDKYTLSDLPDLDCKSLHHLCRGRCCVMSFHLSRQDLDERIVQWEYGNPYHIRQRENGYCVHWVPDTYTCGIYEFRPAICRTYDCRNDDRIWKDFERRILADELKPD
jgi:Fe-S-cluster containining protein